MVEDSCFMLGVFSHTLSKRLGISFGNRFWKAGGLSSVWILQNSPFGFKNEHWTRAMRLAVLIEGLKLVQGDDPIN